MKYFTYICLLDDLCDVQSLGPRDTIHSIKHTRSVISHFELWLKKKDFFWEIMVLQPGTKLHNYLLTCTQKYFCLRLPFILVYKVCLYMNLFFVKKEGVDVKGGLHPLLHAVHWEHGGNLPIDTSLGGCLPGRSRWAFKESSVSHLDVTMSVQIQTILGPHNVTVQMTDANSLCPS